MEGIIKEGDELVEGKEKSPTLDTAIISAAQKVEHYEISSYGTLDSHELDHVSIKKNILISLIFLCL